MLHAKFQVSSRPGTCFSKMQIWPKSSVNRVLNVCRPGKCFFSLLGFEFGVMWGCFSDVFGLPYRLASLLINILLPKLTLLMNDCIQSGYFPYELKIAKVLPLYKSGDVNCFNNYRPISILPLLSKILEKLIYSRLLDFFTDNNIIIPQQFGFRENYSTTHALHMAITRVCKAIDNKKRALGIFVDFSKAFDTVQYNILIHKLEHYGVRERALQLLINYPSNRKQYCCSGDTLCDSINISCGVP